MYLYLFLLLSLNSPVEGRGGGGKGTPYIGLFGRLRPKGVPFPGFGYMKG